MRKLTTSMKTLAVLCLLFGFIAPIFAQSSASTYTLAAKSLETIYDNTLNEATCDFKWGDLKKVDNMADIHVVIKFRKGLDNGQLGQKKSGNQAYYSVQYKTPYYQAIVKDKNGKTILDKYYGAVPKSTTFGKEEGLNADELGLKWRRNREKFYGHKELEGIEFMTFSKDLQQVLTTNTVLIEAPAPPKVVMVNTQSEPVVTEDLYRYRPNYENNIVAQNKRAMEEKQAKSIAKAEKEAGKKKSKKGKSKKKSKKKKPQKAKSKKSKKTNKVEDRGEAKIADNSTQKTPKPKKEKSKKSKKKKSKKSKSKKEKKEVEAVQAEPMVGMAVPEKEEEEEIDVADTRKPQRNIVKIGLLGLPIQNFNLAYERILSGKTSLNIHGSYYKYANKLPFVSNISSLDKGTPWQLSGFSVSPEFRVYGKKKGAPRGFYFAPYLNYAKHQLSVRDVEIEEPEPIEANLEADWTAIGAGVQLGVQWVIKNRVTIDWGFLGLGVNYTTLNVWVQSDLDEVNYEETARELEQDIKEENIPLIGDKLEFSAGEDFIEATLPVFLPALRSRLTVGFWF